MYSNQAEEAVPMSIVTIGHTRVIPGSFGKSLQRVRRHLADAGLSIAGEFDLSDEPLFQLGDGSRSCVVLLVDDPALLFECIVLDRAAAVFVPVHVVISGDRDTTYVHWANPAAASGLRLPIPAKKPLEELCARINKALSELPVAAEPVLMESR